MLSARGQKHTDSYVTLRPAKAVYSDKCKFGHEKPDETDAAKRTTLTTKTKLMTKTKSLIVQLFESVWQLFQLFQFRSKSKSALMATQTTMQTSIRKIKVVQATITGRHHRIHHHQNQSQSHPNLLLIHLVPNPTEVAEFLAAAEVRADKLLTSPNKSLVKNIEPKINTVKYSVHMYVYPRLRICTAVNHYRHRRQWQRRQWRSRKVQKRQRCMHKSRKYYPTVWGYRGRQVNYVYIDIATSIFFYVLRKLAY